jgi:GNAT superfamily N-acetyltransferase
VVDVVLEWLDPNSAEETEFVAFHEVASAAQEVDLPDEEPLLYDHVVNRLRHPFPGLGEVRHWLARCGGEVVATATLVLPEHENNRVALPIVTVHPKSRRQGIGTAVLRALVPEMVGSGREIMEGFQLDRGGAGEAWTVALGFRTVNATILQRLRFADADRSLWDLPTPDGYRLETWVGAAPDDLIVS